MLAIIHVQLAKIALLQIIAPIAPQIRVKIENNRNLMHKIQDFVSAMMVIMMMALMNHANNVIIRAVLAV